LGFVGNYLGEYLKSLNHLVVQTDLKKDLGVYLDVCDKSSINDVLKTHKPTNIIHLAGFSSVKKSFEDPELCMKINALGTRNLLESVRENVKDSKILIISSSEVYGIPEYLPIDEKHPLKGTNPYAKSRIAQEKIIADEF
jgi:GDP-D-mannose dehydratase